jgi:LysM repeat protein
MTKHHYDPDATPTNQDPFWNDDADWTPSAFDRPAPRVSIGAGATVARWWDSLLGGDTPAGRAHGEPASGPRRAGGGAASNSDTGAWFVEPTSRRSNSAGLDPRIARIGGLIVAVTVAVPLFLGFTSSPDDDTLKTADAASTTTVAAIATITTQTIPVGDQTTTSSETAATSGESATTTSGETAATSSSTSGTDDGGQADDTASASAARSTEVQASASSSSSDDDTAAAPPAPSSEASAESACGNTYEVAPGDYWIRLADAADVSLADLLAVNDATTSTELMPGDSICLPVGASTPSPPAPTTTARPTTTAPRPTTTNPPATSPPTTNPPTTNAPTTTRPPTTTAPPSSSTDVETIIRSVWPDHLEEKALTIAWRESRYVPTAYNGHCCYGLFQMYYSVHRSWLTAYGVNQASDLYDPWKNARAAYALYQRAGGWSPWSQTNY